MSSRVQTKRVATPKYAKVPVDDDRWIWGVIFTTAALTALSMVTLLSVSIS